MNRLCRRGLDPGRAAPDPTFAAGDVPDLFDRSMLNGLGYGAGFEPHLAEPGSCCSVLRAGNQMYGGAVRCNIIPFVPGAANWQLGQEWDAAARLATASRAISSKCPQQWAKHAMLITTHTGRPAVHVSDSRLAG